MKTVGEAQKEGYTQLACNDEDARVQGLAKTPLHEHDDGMQLDELVEQIKATFRRSALKGIALTSPPKPGGSEVFHPLWGTMDR
ncbi:hypothetical protein [Hansschlegelia plantiphila]|uniref:Uncharacterized protein n=1 Tax=Hansschlegelia plantiphila TaxID=374655 RepID=A0A9W6MWN5_9HYPH|nr:hypothetical protein [Hansschlegelia plantiphila]GLK69193.1 hypothetical protein GCM10008179_28310 [Hansschlegelia plantiphila]